MLAACLNGGPDSSARTPMHWGYDPPKTLSDYRMYKRPKGTFFSPVRVTLCPEEIHSAHEVALPCL